MLSDRSKGDSLRDRDQDALPAALISKLTSNSFKSELSSVSRIEILITGNELLEGVISDQHAQTISRTLINTGFMSSRFTTVGDKLEEIVEALSELTHRAELCVVTGGLGPTVDDRTIDAISMLSGVEAPINEVCWNGIISRFPQLKEAERSNRRQARLPEGGVHLHNQRGTAPGIYIQVHQCHLFAFPGPPQELSWFVEQYLGPFLQYTSTKTHTPRITRTLRVALIGESSIAERIDSLALPQSIDLGYQALGSEHRVKISASTLGELDEACMKIQRVAAPYYINDRDRSLAEEVITVARAKNLKMGFAESCTGGQLSAQVTAVPGSSSVFWGSVISYSNEVKMKTLNVPEEVLVDHGAVSEPCAEAMAIGARRALQVDWAISVTGIAGPGGGTVSKPVGTVCFAWSSADTTFVKKRQFRGHRSRVQSRAVTYALFILLKCLRGESVEGV